MSKGRISIAIAAMGGQGGGVLADWLVDIAEHAGWYAQSTSVPGVAQRTGATVYYIEIVPYTAGDPNPVLALMPVPGDVDLVVAAELIEAARAVQRGIVTPDRTTLIASSHRAYAIGEKAAMSDGRVDGDVVRTKIERAAQRLICFDLQALAESHGTVISATLLGAIAGTGTLPFAREAFESAIRTTGKAVEANLEAFDAAFVRATGEVVDQPAVAAESTPPPVTPAAAAFVERIEAELPEPARVLARAAVPRLVDYQDAAYAGFYLDRMKLVAELDAANGGAARGFELTCETARYLALWMSYEDTIRVADLKTRSERFDRCRTEVRARPDDIMYLTEFMHPRVQEVADTLPAGVGRWLLRTPWASKAARLLVERERKVETAKLGGFLTLYVVASLRFMRRRTLRYAEEQAAMETWLQRIAGAVAGDYALALEIVRCQHLIKGYSDTYARGKRNYALIMEGIDKGAFGATRVAELRAAALADEEGRALAAALSAPA